MNQTDPLLNQPSAKAQHTATNVFSQLSEQEISRHIPTLTKSPYWWLNKRGENTVSILFDAKTQLLWQLVPADQEKRETHAILGRDYRTLTQGPEVWNKRGDKGETDFTVIPAGWHVANATRTQAVCRLATFKADLGLQSTGGAYKHFRYDSDCSSYSYCYLEVNSQGAVRATEGSFCVLLEKDGAENLPLSTDLSDAIERLSTFGKSFKQTWQLPWPAELTSLILKDNPYREGEGVRLQNCVNWRTDSEDLLISQDAKGKTLNASILSRPTINPRTLSVSRVWQNKTPAQIVQLLLENVWQLSAHQKEISIVPLTNRELLTDMDYRPVRLPKLEDSVFTDLNKGIWEFWGQDEALLAAEKIVARNPLKDMRSDNVAIDFGTSSTVVAVTQNGKAKLLRVGVKDFYAPVKATDFENPTVLEFIDILKLQKAWQSKACRPEMDWSWLCASHEAQTNFRNSQSDIGLVSSVLPKMKQWALRQSQDYKIKLIDQANDFAYELPQLSLREYRKNQLPQVSAQDPIDPIELYAWFLGMTINWRTNGIFTNYYMTFPVAYPKEVKDKILSSFQRGLIRSMPESLVAQSEFHEYFFVKELASEPAAYAASALEALAITPTADGVAYGVFDFGGGTTDFDYGIYRSATTEEEDEDGTERVLEHIKNEGDKFLGGENLLENLAFRVFNANLDICLSKRIAFTQPLDANSIPGTELLIDKTQAAQTNTIIMMGKLRSFWETGDYNSSSRNGLERVVLIDREGKNQDCELTIPVETLDAYLYQRIGMGFEAFFIGLKATFEDAMPQQIHILLAGNSSRSKWVSAFFGDEGDNEAFKTLVTRIFGEQAPEFIIHAPLAIDQNDVFKPTAKTGVALGLLKLCTGELKLIKRHATNHNEAAFNHYVGRIRQGKLQVALMRATEYGVWHELGPINQEGAVYLKYTQAVKASTGEMDKNEDGIFEKRINFVGNLAGCRAFVRAISPNSIEICSATSKEAIASGSLENLKVINLD